jgi:hypothetical protein
VDLTTGQQCVRAGAQANGLASFISKVPASSRMERDVFLSNCPVLNSKSCRVAIFS